MSFQLGGVGFGNNYSLTSIAPSRTSSFQMQPPLTADIISRLEPADRNDETEELAALGITTAIVSAIVLAKKGKLGPKAKSIVNNAWTSIKGVFSKKNNATPTEKVVTPAAPSGNPAAKPPAAQSAKPAATSAATETAEAATKFNFASKFKPGELKVVGDEAMKLLNGETLSPEKTQKAVKHLQKILQSGANDNFRQNILNCLNERFGTNYDLAHIPALKKILA